MCIKEDAIEWIIRNQFGRRNLPTYERAKLALRLKPIIKEKAKEQQGKRTDLSQTFGKSSIDTNKELGKIAGTFKVSRNYCFEDERKTKNINKRS